MFHGLKRAESGTKGTRARDSSENGSAGCRPLHGRILAFLQHIRDDFRLPMLYVTHDPTELEAIAEEMVVLERGRVVAVGPTAQVIATATCA